MDLEKYTYALLLVGSVFVPFVRSFENKISFYKKWKYLFPAIVIPSAIFIIWDIWFTASGVWGFNEQFVSGAFFAGLPVEEWLFFVIIPYACLFIYEVLKYFIPQEKVLFNWKITNGILFLALLLVGILNQDKLYTFVVFLSAAFFLGVFNLSKKTQLLSGYFYFAYFISLVPFLIVNYFLTSLPVVSYDDMENLGVKIFTIPIEDSVYLFGLLVLNVFLFESFQQKKAQTHR